MRMRLLVFRRGRCSRRDQCPPDKMILTAALSLRMAPVIGTSAPEISAPAYVSDAKESEELQLSDYQGRWVALFFYPRDFTFVCPTEIQRFAELQAEFEKEHAAIIGASTDSFDVHKAWYETDERLADVTYPVIADSTHEVSQAFGVLDEREGKAVRATFLIDPDGIVRHQSVNDGEVGWSVSETLRLLKAYRTGEYCGAEWEPGDEPVGPSLVQQPKQAD